MLERKAGEFRRMNVSAGLNSAPTDQVPANQLIGVADVEFKLVVWGDELGRKREAVVVAVPTKDGPKLYAAKNGEDWTANLCALPSKIQKQFADKLAMKQVETKVPETDKVEIG
jgi:hypothetical protein